MKVTKWVTFEQEVDVDVDIEEFIASLPSNADKLYLALGGISQFHKLLKLITDEVISEMNDTQRAIIFKFLTEQASRFRKE